MVELASVLRWVHMLSGIAWFGTVFYMSHILLPSMKNMASSSKHAILSSILPRTSMIVTVLSSLTIGFGVVVALLRSNFDPGVFLRMPWGHSILTGGSLGASMFALHLYAGRKVLRVLRSIKLASPDEPSPGLLSLERRLRTMVRIEFTVLTVAIALMIYAAHGI